MNLPAVHRTNLVNLCSISAAKTLELVAGDQRSWFGIQILDRKQTLGVRSILIVEFTIVQNAAEMALANFLVAVVGLAFNGN